MYSDFYGFTKLPFSITPDPQFVYYSQSHHESLAQMLYGIQERKCLMICTGEVGVGKTTMIFTLMSHLGKDTNSSLIFDTHVDPPSLYKYMFADFGIENASDSRADNTIALKRYLTERLDAGQRTLLILDEAHSLSPEIYKEVVHLTNFETRSHKLLQIILVGQPELKTILNSVEFRQLKQRINLRTTIRSLEQVDSTNYIRHRLQAAGSKNQDIFSSDALKLIFKYSKGLPRMINTICDNSLLMGFSRQQDRINAAMIQEAYSSLMDISEQDEQAFVEAELAAPEPPVIKPASVLPKSAKVAAPRPAAAIAAEMTTFPLISSPESQPNSRPAAAVNESITKPAAKPKPEQAPHNGPATSLPPVATLVESPSAENKERRRETRQSAPKVAAELIIESPGATEPPSDITMLSMTADSARELMPALVEDDPLAKRQYRLLATRLDAISRKSRLRTVMVTSSVPQEGKTITSINLAFSLTQDGTSKVLLMDSDLRQPALHTYFGHRSIAGVSEILQGQLSLERGLHSLDIPNFYAMFAGKTPKDPISLLDSPQMTRLLEELGNRFDFVILDSPPIIPIADSCSLAEFVDGVIVVVRANHTAREMVMQALDDLNHSNILGLVFNNQRSKFMKSGYQYNYGYLDQSKNDSSNGSSAK